MIEETDLKADLKLIFEPKIYSRHRDCVLTVELRRSSSKAGPTGLAMLQDVVNPRSGQVYW